MNQPRHVLELSCGIICELVLDEKIGQALCIWSARSTFELMPTILREYPRWRDEILEAWSQRSGQISRSKSTSKNAADRLFRSRAERHPRLLASGSYAVRTKKSLISDFASRLEEPFFALHALGRRGQRPWLGGAFFNPTHRATGGSALT
jgi:hypothetical protein